MLNSKFITPASPAYNQTVQMSKKDWTVHPCLLYI